MGHANHIPVLFAQLAIIPDLAIMAAGITETSDAANATSGCTATGVGGG